MSDSREGEEGRPVERGGQRRGAGRKRLYDPGYKAVQTVLWRSISIHAELFDEWEELRKRFMFKSNSVFAKHLLELFKRSKNVSNPIVRQSSSTQSAALSPIPGPSGVRLASPIMASTPRSQTKERTTSSAARSLAFPTTTQLGHLQGEKVSSVLSVHRERSISEYPFIDTIIPSNSLANAACEGVSDDDESEGDEDVFSDISSSNSEDESYDDDDLLNDINHLEISCDEDSLKHDLLEGDDQDATTLEDVDMDISSDAETPGVIETNIPVMPAANQELLVEDIGQLGRLLPPDYHHRAFSSDIKKELDLVEEKKFICSVSKLQQLFEFCMDRGCNMPLTDVTKRFVGCTLEIRWRCKAGHCGDWFSSNMVSRVYINNIQSAASILFTGNSFNKVSLLAKSLHLAFISSTTFLTYQKKYLAPQIHHMWKSTQLQMFEALGDQPVVVAGDGQMDSPGFSAKYCTYSLMHGTLDYILQVEVVDVRQAELKSTVMEKVGCERALDAVLRYINVKEVVTDASSQIIKLLGMYM